MPFLGPIWRSTDHMWEIHARRTGCSLPPEAARRLWDRRQAWPEDDEGMAELLRREREELSITLWLALPLWIPAVAAGMFAAATILVGVFLPLYQLIGTIGG